MNLSRLLSLIAFPILAAIASQCGGETGAIDQDRMQYFKSTYDESRAEFRSLCKGLKGAVGSSLAVASTKESDLTIDTCSVGARVPQKLIIITSGLHGIEGFTGSAVQRFWMKELLSSVDHERTGYLFIHAINPFGFRLERRVTENNVDLNRNFDVTPALFSSHNDGYVKINELLNPDGKVSIGSMGNRLFPVRAVYNIIKHSMRALRQAALQGQYEFPKGIYFGGSKFEQQKSLIEPLLVKESAPYSYVMVVDLHTGYGERGKLNFFPNAIKDATIRKNIETVYAGYQVDYGDTADFYTTTGDFSEYVGKLLTTKKYIPMVFEYGTLDSQTTSGSIKSIHNMIVENQGYWNGYESEGDLNEVKHRFREHFYPSSQVWRTKVIAISAEVFPLVVDRFSKLQ